MQNRRQFIGATALAMVPAALAFESGNLVAQAARTGDAHFDEVTVRVLNQIAADNARAYNDATAHGTRVDHYRTAAAGLRMMAALDLDALVRRGIRDHGRMHGRDASPFSHLDRGRVAQELRRAGMRISTDDVEKMHLRFAPKPEAIAAVTAPQFSLSRQVREFAAMLDAEAEQVARLETGPLRRVIRPAECDKFAYQLDMLSYATGILCLFGANPGCLASMTSIALISTAMYFAGC